MIDLHELRLNPDKYRKACQLKRVHFDIDAFLEIDKNFRALKVQVEERRAAQNAASKALPKLNGEEKSQQLSLMKELSEQLKVDEEKLRELDKVWNQQQLFIPSMPLESVPEGADDTQNVEVRKWGEPRSFDFKIRDHTELGKLLDIIDFERGVKIAGARQYFLKGEGAFLQHAVLALAMELLQAKGYTIMDPPHLVRYQAMMGTSYFPGGEEQAYQLDGRDGDVYLIGTSEVSVASYHADELLKVAELPKRYAGYSPCYRREAGSYGKDTQGLYRVHQFYKVEQVIICKADAQESAKFHAELLANAEQLLQILELPYRVVDVCSGDMGRGQVYKNDLETWMPSRNAYGETHSCSTFYDFQARRLNMRYKDENGKNIYCHTLNNTCVASPRVLISILELNQNRDGSVNIPKALQKFMGGREVIAPAEGIR